MILVNFVPTGFEHKDIEVTLSFFVASIFVFSSLRTRCMDKVLLTSEAPLLNLPSYFLLNSCLAFEPLSFRVIYCNILCQIEYVK